MKTCWYVLAKITDPKTGNHVADCWTVYRRWFWWDALDIVNLDVSRKEVTYPGMFYDLKEIKEV